VMPGRDHWLDALLDLDGQTLERVLALKKE
jgi:hypothetical protein